MRKIRIGYVAEAGKERNTQNVPVRNSGGKFQIGKSGYMWKQYSNGS
jgi:hypothetical protein